MYVNKSIYHYYFAFAFCRKLYRLSVPFCVFLCVWWQLFYVCVEILQGFHLLIGEKDQSTPLRTHHIILLCCSPGIFNFFSFCRFHFRYLVFFFFSSFVFLPSNQRTMKSHKQDEASGCCVMVFIVSVNGFCEIATGPLLDVAPLLLLILINAQRLTQIIALLLLKQTLGALATL